MERMFRCVSALSVIMTFTTDESVAKFAQGVFRSRDSPVSCQFIVKGTAARRRGSRSQGVDHCH
jgi:hypothetical protein